MKVLCIMGAMVFAAGIFLFTFSATSRRNPHDINSHNTMSQQKVVKIPVSIVESGARPWNLEKIKLPRNNILRHSVFTGIDSGLVIGVGDGYKTVDGGKSWQPIDIVNYANTYISSVSFVSQHSGWASVIFDPSGYGNSQGIRGWLFHTSDGGLTWDRRGSDEPMVVKRIYFTDESTGWAISQFLYHTDDGGLKWNKVSTELVTSLHRRNSISRSVKNIHAANNFQATVLMSGGEILETHDKGKTWRQLNQLPFPVLELGESMKVGLNYENDLWFLVGADSREGVWGTLSIIDKSGAWKHYSMNMIKPADVLFISETEILLSGSMLPDSKELGSWDKRDGIILYSSDKGYNWNTTYRSSEVKSIIALAAINSNYIWAVGDNGLVIKITR